MTAIAIDLGGTYIKFGLYRKGSILHNENFPSNSEMGLMPKLEDITQSVMDLIAKSEEPVVGLGIAFPGIVDSQEARVLSTNKKYRDAVGFNFKGWASKTFGLPVFLESDARSALVGEWKFGSAKGSDNVVMITLGTGMGTAALMQGKLLHGAHYQAGSMGGHFSVNWMGHTCNCGNRGCVEAEASTWRLPDIIKADDRYMGSLLANQPVLDFKTVFELASRDDLSLAIRNQCLEIWSVAVINLVHAYDPEIVIMGGGVLKSHDVIVPYVQEAVSRRSWTPWGNVEVRTASNPDYSVLLGAGYLLTRSVD